MAGLQVVDLSAETIGWFHGGDARPVAIPQGPPPVVDGLTVGLAEFSTTPPHGGERHPDGDEILLIVDGRVRVQFGDALDQALELVRGQACIVPKGVWHRVVPLGPTRLVFVTPGPNKDYRLQA